MATPADFLAVRPSHPAARWITGSPPHHWKWISDRPPATSLTIPETYVKAIRQVIERIDNAIRKVRKEGGDPRGLEEVLGMFQRAQEQSIGLAIERVTRTESEPGTWRTGVEKLLSAGANAIGLAENKFFAAVSQLDKNGDLIGPSNKK